MGTGHAVTLAGYAPPGNRAVRVRYCARRSGESLRGSRPRAHTSAALGLSTAQPRRTRGLPACGRPGARANAVLPVPHCAAREMRCARDAREKAWVRSSHRSEGLMQTLLADGGGLDLRKLCIVRNEMRIAFRAPAGCAPMCAPWSHSASWCVGAGPPLLGVEGLVPGES